VHELIQIETLLTSPIANSLLIAAPSGHRQVDERILLYLQKHYRYSRPGCDCEVFLHHLSSKYGPIFSDGTDLLPLAIAIHALPLGWLSLSGWNSSPDRILLYEWLSKFHNMFGRDLEELNVDETHLFAIFFVFAAHNFTATWDSKSTRHVYAIGFAKIMRHLCNSFLSGPRSRSFPFSGLWHWMLSTIRGYEFCLDLPINRLEKGAIDFRWDLHCLSELIGPIDGYLLEYPSLHTIYTFCWLCLDIKASLKTCLLVFLQSRRVGLNLTRDVNDDVETSMRSLRRKVDNIKSSKRALDTMRFMVQELLDFDLLIISTVCRYQKSI